MKNGRKIGNMQLMKNMWDDLGYQHFALSSQNLRDLAAALEKTLGDVASDIVSQEGRTETRDQEKESEQEENSRHNISNNNTSENCKWFEPRSHIIK